MEYKIHLDEESLSAITDAIKDRIQVIPLEVTENDVYEAPSGKAYSPVTVNVPNPSTGTLQITENGEGINVTEYAAVDVNVPNPSTGTLQITENGEGIDVTQYAAVDVNVTSAYSTVTINLVNNTANNLSVRGLNSTLNAADTINLRANGTEVVYYPKLTQGETNSNIAVVTGENPQYIDVVSATVNGNTRYSSFLTSQNHWAVVVMIVPTDTEITITFSNNSAT